MATGGSGLDVTGFVEGTRDGLEIGLARVEGPQGRKRGIIPISERLAAIRVTAPRFSRRAQEAETQKTRRREESLADRSHSHVIVPERPGSEWPVGRRIGINAIFTMLNGIAGADKAGVVRQRRPGCGDIGALREA